MQRITYTQFCSLYAPTDNIAVFWGDHRFIVEAVRLDDRFFLGASLTLDKDEPSADEATTAIHEKDFNEETADFVTTQDENEIRGWVQQKITAYFSS